MRRVALLVGVSLFSWACYGGAASTTTTAAPTTTQLSSTTAPPATSAPARPEVLVTNDEGVFYIDSTGDVAQLVKGRVAYAVDDTRGGLLFQVERGRSGSEVPGLTEVWWVPRGTGEAQALIVPTPGAGHELTLYDAFEDPDGHVQVVYVRSDTPPAYWDWVACTYEGDCPEVPTWDSGITEGLIDRLRLFDLDLGTVTEVEAIGVSGSGLGQVSAGGGLLALMRYSQVSSWCVFIDPAAVGGRVEVPGAPDECEGEPCPRACVLSPTGSLLGYSLGSKVVLVDTSGQQVGEITSAQEVASFDLREDYALILSTHAPGVLVRIDGSLSEFTVLVDGRARFATAPVDMEGPVIPPVPASAAGGGADYYLFGQTGLFRVVDGVTTQLVDGPVSMVWDDHTGGVIFSPDGEDILQLRAGETNPSPIILDYGSYGDVIFTGILDGHPTLFLEVDDPAVCGDAYGPLSSVDLITGDEQQHNLCLGTEDWGPEIRSIGNGRFVGAVWSALVAIYTSSDIRFWDAAGNEIEVPVNPFPPTRSCIPCELDALISPDGTLLAYRYRPDSFTFESPNYPEADCCDPESPSWYAELHDAWWGKSRHIPALFAVIDLETGATLWQTQVAVDLQADPWSPGTQLRDFDGRFVVVSNYGGDGVIYDTSGETPLLTVKGDVTLMRPPADPSD